MYTCISHHIEMEQLAIIDRSKIKQKENEGETNTKNEF